MNFTVSQAKLSSAKGDALACFFYEDEALFSQQRTAIESAFPLTKHAFESGDFKAKKKTVSIVYTGIPSLPRLIMVGLGKKDDVTLESLRRCTAAATKAAAKAKIVSWVVDVPADTKFTNYSVNLAITETIGMAVYKYDKHMTQLSDDQRLSAPENTTLLVESRRAADEAKKAAEFASIIAEGVRLCRDLANAPNNEVYPEALAKMAKSALKHLEGVNVEVLEKKKIEKLEMGGLLAVNQGADRPPVFIIMEYKGGASTDKPIVLVGKGVTFDTGGISIKPSAGMADMKMDMHGAATVIGALYVAAKAKLPCNVVALVPSTENMPGGDALVPGDIIKMMNGKTVEVDNTDAEGRLILADALHYANRYDPAAVVDVATLTGACVVALGHVTTGLCSNNEALVARLKASAERTAEHVCELPMHDDYDELIKSDVADVKNSGGRPAGAITAALFLKKFIGSYPWAHLDVAGTAMSPKENDYHPKGGTGVGVRLLADMIKNWESK